MPHYRVRLHIADSAKVKVCWQTQVPVEPYQELDRDEIERRARRQAVEVFGADAAEWTLIDAERRAR